MALADDIANDYQNFDGVETVSVHCTGTNATVSAAKALPSMVRFSDLAMLGSAGVESDARVWTVFVATLAGNALRRGDTISDSAGNIWNVNSVNLMTLGSRYRCLCVRE